jgi:hypothetical protein
MSVHVAVIVFVWRVWDYGSCCCQLTLCKPDVVLPRSYGGAGSECICELNYWQLPVMGIYDMAYCNFGETHILTDTHSRHHSTVPYHTMYISWSFMA